MASRPRPPDAALLEVLTRPREAGTPDAAAAREITAARLRALGYAVTIHPFHFHPSTLWAFPLLGAGLGWLALVLAPLLLLPTVPAASALAAWVLGAASLAAVAYGVGAGAAPLRFGGPAREDANLIAIRGSETQVRRWIVAHLDTKAQGHSMAGRLVAVWFVIVAGLGLTAMALARLRGPVPLPLVVGSTALGLLAGVLAGRGRLLGRSPGARDNGSGVVAALAAAEAAVDSAIGLVITGAEEFGLVGAGARARARPEFFRGREMVNLDTLDDVGALYVVSHDRLGDTLARECAGSLAGLGLPLRLRRLPLGILVDSLAAARAGAAAVTVARLKWSTLRRIHTPRDTGDKLAFETAERVGRALIE